MKKSLIIVFFVTFFSGFAQNQTHTIKPNETIEHIAKTYRVSPSDLFKLNPELKKGLTTGTVIKIPSGKVKHYSTQRPLGFIPHTVAAKETFFMLSQEYNISIDDIKRYNFELYDRDLREGDRLSIPIFPKSSTAIQKGIQGQKKYVVKPQESLWRIAKNNNISQEELERMNPNVTAENLQEGQEIWIPITASDLTAPKRFNNQDLVLYSVEKGEGFYSLERKFGISEAELVKINPELSSGLKSDSQIWVPKENFERYKYGAAISLSDRNFKYSGNAVASASSSDRVKEISFVLPFKIADIPNDATKIAALKSRLNDNKVTPIATDFYSGVMIALDSLQKSGFSFKVNVFDSEISENSLQEIATSTEIKNSQVIVGPFLAKSFNAFASYITNSDNAILAPLSNKNIELKPNVYQTLPTDELQQAKMIDFIHKNYANASVLILADSKNTAIADRLEQTFYE